MNHCTGFDMAAGHFSSASHAYPANILPTDHPLGPLKCKIYLAPCDTRSLGGKFLSSFPGVTFFRGCEMHTRYIFVGSGLKSQIYLCGGLASMF